MKTRALLLLIFLFSSACGAPIRFTPTVEPTAAASIRPLPTNIPVETSTLEIVPSATIAQTATPISIPTEHSATSATPSIEPGPVVWDFCPKSDRTYVGQPLALDSISMKDEANGWAVDVKGHVLHSNDGGITWQNVTPIAGQYRPGGLFALDALRAWVAPDESCKCTSHACSSPSISHGLVWNTADGGKTWQESDPFSLALEGQGWGNQVPYFSPVSLQFIDKQTGWLLAAVNGPAEDRWMELFQTANGGQSWQRVADRRSGLSIPGIQGAAFLDTQTGWLAVNAMGLASIPPMPLKTARANQQEIATILKTTDGGRTWTPQPLPVPQGLDKVLDYATQGEIKCGNLQVQAWPPRQVAVKVYCHAVADQMPRVYNDVFYSGDGGQTWQDWIDTSSVDAISPTQIWHLSSIQSPSYSLWWSDGGEKIWNYVREVTWQGDLNFVDVQRGWVIAINGNEKALVYTEDGGKNWKILHPVIGP